VIWAGPLTVVIVPTPTWPVVTTRGKTVLRPRGVPVTVTGKLPAGVEAAVVTVSVLEQLGVQLPGAKEAVAPAGRPEAEKLTGWVVPASSVALTVVVLDWPAVSVMPPAFSE
jgi:hypothetical protein